MTDRLYALWFGGLMALALVSPPALWAGPTDARECLSQASVAAEAIELAGDQSAARRHIACALAGLDPRAALELVGGIRRPSDAARALGAVSVALSRADPAGAQQAAATAARLLLRIAEPARRYQEQRLLLGEIAALGREALAAGPEMSPDEARLAIMVGRCRSDPAGALALVRAWQIAGPLADRVLPEIAVGLAEADPGESLKLATSIDSDALRERALWRIAEIRPPAEALGIAQQVTDPIVRSAMLTSAAVRMAAENPSASLAAIQEVAVAPDSARAQLAAALTPTGAAEAIQVARGLPARPRAWALGRIALWLAARKPEEAERLLAEAGATPELVRLTVGRMAATDPTRALRLGRSLPAGEVRDAALTGVAAALAASDPRQAADLAWEITGPQARDRAVQAVVRRLAMTDVEAATSLIGLVSEPERALRLRAEVSALVAPRDPSAASHLLGTLPPSDYRSEAALRGAAALLIASGDLQQAQQLARLGLEPGLALRWLVPRLAQEQSTSPITLASAISDPYLRALALADAARRLQGLEARSTPSPSRARMIRPVAEWQGI